MSNKIIIPGTLNVQEKTGDLYLGINISGMPGGVDNKELEEATWSSRAEAMRNTQSMMGQMDKKEEEGTVVDAYGNPYVITSKKAGYMPRDRGYIGEMGAESDYEKRKPSEYPLFGEGDRFGPLIRDVLAREITGYLLPQIGNSGAEKIIKQFLNSLHGGAASGAKVNWARLSPLGAVLTGISGGAAEIETLYTGIHPTSGIEMPIYIQKKGEKLPVKLDEVLEENLRHMYLNGKSIYDDNSKLQELYRRDFSEPEMDFITMGDNPDWFEDPVRARGWPVKDTTWLQNGYAKTKDVGHVLDPNGYYTMNVKIDDTTTLPFKVGVYKEATTMPRFAYWLTTAASYRLTNPFFKLAKRGAFRLSRDYGQTMCENHYKAASAITRFATKDLLGSMLGYHFERNPFNYEHLGAQN